MKESGSSKVLIIYTGGTIGMYTNPDTGSLAPVDFSQLLTHIPNLARLKPTIGTISFAPVIDSSDISVGFWRQLALTIADNYSHYDGFVVLHGTDTMSYTASVLSFMLRHLHKPVILTGSQLPIGTLRSDGKVNLITAIEIAAAQQRGYSIVPEVCVYFDNQLYRGNRTSKQNTEFFDAFRSKNYPALAEVGINIRYNYSAIRSPKRIKSFEVFTELSDDVAILKLFPGISEKFINNVLSTPDLKAVVLESFGAGNAPTYPWFLSALEKAIANGIIILNTTQCAAGSVLMGHYETSLQLIDMGVISGRDLTSEAAVTKLMFLLGSEYSRGELLDRLSRPISGEMSAI